MKYSWLFYEYFMAKIIVVLEEEKILVFLDILEQHLQPAMAHPAECPKFEVMVNTMG